MTDSEATFAKGKGKVIEKHCVYNVSATSFADAENPYKTCPKLMLLRSGWTARAGARRGRRLARRQESGITVRDVDFRIITPPPSFLVKMAARILQAE